VPLVTVSIPLYRFVEIVCANVAAIDCRDVENLISDRQGFDFRLSIDTNTVLL